MNKPKILLLITNLGKGGAQKVFYDHALAFSAHYDVTEAVFNSEEDERLLNSGLPLLSLDGQARSALPGPVGRLVSRAKALAKVTGEQHSRLVVSHMDGANWVNALSGGRVPKILVVHGTVLHDNAQSGWKQWLRKNIIIPYLYNKASLTVAVSDGIADELREHCHVKNVVSIPNFFDVQDIEKKAQEPLPEQYRQLFDQHPVLVSSGRFAEQKKQVYLLKVFAQVKQQAPGVKLVLLGDGELRNQLISTAGELGLTVCNAFDPSMPYHDNYDVYLPGYVSNPIQFLHRSKLFLFPSGWEGFPMALCEAMVAGVPVLSADCPTGPRQILAPGTVDHTYQLTQTEWTPYGCLLPMTNQSTFEAEWVNTILALLKDDQKCKDMVQQARLRMNDYDKPTVMALWKKTIDQLLFPAS